MYIFIVVAMQSADPEPGFNFEEVRFFKSKVMPV